MFEASMQDLLYFNTPANGLLEASAKEKLELYYREQYSDPAAYFQEWMMNNKPALRRRFAELINCRGSELAFVPNTSYAMAAFCSSLPESTKVMMYDQDYPSVYQPFRLHGFEMSLFSAEEDNSWNLDMVKSKLLKDKIDVFALSHIQYLSGYKADVNDLGTFCRAHNILFLVDATQSLGAEQIDVQTMNIDVLVASNYKWMNAGLGSAVLFIREDLIESFPPAIGGFGSYVSDGDKFEYQSSIMSYEPGHLAIASLLCLEAVLEHRKSSSIQAISTENRKLSGQFRQLLAEHGWAQVGQHWDEKCKSAIVVAEGTIELQHNLLKLNIACSFRGGNIRFGFHQHNTAEELDEMFRRL